jgi:hypothetical protein
MGFFSSDEKIPGTNLRIGNSTNSVINSPNAVGLLICIMAPKKTEIRSAVEKGHEIKKAEAFKSLSVSSNSRLRLLRREKYIIIARNAVKIIMCRTQRPLSVLKYSLFILRKYVQDSKI